MLQAWPGAGPRARPAVCGRWSAGAPARPGFTPGNPGAGGGGRSPHGRGWGRCPVTPDPALYTTDHAPFPEPRCPSGATAPGAPSPPGHGKGPGAGRGRHLLAEAGGAARCQRPAPLGGFPPAEGLCARRQARHPGGGERNSIPSVQRPEPRVEVPARPAPPEAGGERGVVACPPAPGGGGRPSGAQSQPLFTGRLPVCLRPHFPPPVRALATGSSVAST